MTEATEATETGLAQGERAPRRAGRVSLVTGRDILTLAIFAFVVLTMPWWLVEIGGYRALATLIVIWALFALGFDILLGFTGYLSFGHAAFFGSAAYFTGLSLKHLSAGIIPAMAITLVCTLVIAVVLGVLTLRRTGIYFSILTLAFAEMAHALVFSSTLQDWTGGDNGLTGIPSPSLFGSTLSSTQVFYLCAAFLIGGFAIARMIRRSPFGLMLRSIKENPMRLEYTGVNVWAYKMMAFIISALYAGIAGSLIVIYEPYVATEYINWTTSGEVVIMSVIGGVGTLVGPMLGAGFMLYFENVMQESLGAQWKLVLGIIFVLIVIFMPGGFVDLARRIWKAMGHKVSARRHNVPDMEGSVQEEHAPHRPDREHADV
jgi:branched-chain amino acid transport system permease protein